jgi:hypothetical protein
LGCCASIARTPRATQAAQPAPAEAASDVFLLNSNFEAARLRWTLQSASIAGVSEIEFQ